MAKMARTVLSALFIVMSIVLLASCGAQQISPTPAADMPNPASVYCEEHRGKVELRQDASGNVAGTCVFADGSECDEWAYFRGECKPGSTPSASGREPTVVEAESSASGWKTYRHEALGYRFDYPADARVEPVDDRMKALSITGPLVGDEHWPVIFVNHPGDREDFHPPEGADLARWLTDHNLLVDERQPDAQVARTRAIHTRRSRGQQSYAADTYYFARSGQLYTIVLLHTGDKEDWTLYGRFLASFHFIQ